MITRRETLRTSSLLLALAAAAGVVRQCVPIPAPAAERTGSVYCGPGWYAFARPNDETFVRVFWCERDASGFIDLADALDEPPEFSLSPDAFDYACFGICLTQAEAERRSS